MDAESAWSATFVSLDRPCHRRLSEDRGACGVLMYMSYAADLMLRDLQQQIRQARAELDVSVEVRIV